MQKTMLIIQLCYYSSLPRAPKLRKVLLCKAFFFVCEKATAPHRACVGAAEGCDLLILLLFRASRTGETFHKDSPHGIAAGNRRPVLPQACL